MANNQAFVLATTIAIGAQRREIAFRNNGMELIVHLRINVILYGDWNVCKMFAFALILINTEALVHSHIAVSTFCISFFV